MFCGDRRENRRYEPRLALAKLKIGNDQAHDRKRRPLVDTPVEIAVLNGITGGSFAFGGHIAVRWVDIVRHGFGHTVKHQAYPKTSRQQHTDP